MSMTEDALHQAIQDVFRTFPTEINKVNIDSSYIHIRRDLDYLEVKKVCVPYDVVLDHPNIVKMIEDFITRRYEKMHKLLDNVVVETFREK